MGANATVAYLAAREGIGRPETDRERALLERLEKALFDRAEQWDYAAEQEEIASKAESRAERAEERREEAEEEKHEAEKRANAAEDKLAALETEKPEASGAWVKLVEERDALGADRDLWRNRREAADRQCKAERDNANRAHESLRAYREQARAWIGDDPTAVITSAHWREAAMARATELGEVKRQLSDARAEIEALKARKGKKR
jgi:hypothetical protein